MVELLLTVAATIAFAHGVRWLPGRLRESSWSAAALCALVPALAALRSIPDDKKFEEAISAGRGVPFSALEDSEVLGKTVLTTDPRIVAATPLFGFLSHKDHYSHPSARYRERIEFVRRLSKSSERHLCRLLEENPFGRIDYLFIDSAHFTTTVDAFPADGRSEKIRVPIAIETASCLESRSLEGGTLYRLKRD